MRDFSRSIQIAAPVEVVWAILSDGERWPEWTPTVIAKYGVERSGAGTRATLSLRFDGIFGGLVARLTRDLNEGYLKLEAEGLKARSEAVGEAR